MKDSIIPSFSRPEEDDDGVLYGRLRDPNYHDREFHNQRNQGIDYSCDDDYIYDDPESLVTCLGPMLPSPFRESSFLPRHGWNYRPSNRYTPLYDRLGSGVAKIRPRNRHQLSKRSKENIPIEQSKNNLRSSNYPLQPSTKMIIPASWTSTLPLEITTQRENDKSKSGIVGSEDTRDTKRQRHDNNSSAAATVVTTSTMGESSSSSSSTNNNSMQKHLQKQQKDNSNVTTGSLPPKAALYQWYGKKPRKIQLTGEQYVTWDNGQINHKQLFTSIFVCPITKEVFLAGQWSGSSEGAVEGISVEPDKDGLCWYPRKVMAEHAVAARAWDCLLMREGGNLGDYRLGGLEPYWPSQRPTWPINRIPARILNSLRKCGQEINENDCNKNPTASKAHNDNLTGTSDSDNNEDWLDKKPGCDKDKRF